MIGCIVTFWILYQVLQRLTTSKSRVLCDRPQLEGVMAKCFWAGENVNALAEEGEVSTVPTPIRQGGSRF
jgi:hypothetical protein